MSKLAMISWSGGKDAALSFYKLQEQGYKIKGLLITVCAKTRRVFHHNTPISYIEAQAKACKTPLYPIFVPPDATAKEYGQIMTLEMEKIRNSGVEKMAFGDIFLQWAKKRREENLRSIGMEALFPLWQEKTSLLAPEILSLGFDAKIISIDTSVVPSYFLGKSYKELIENLPEGVDPCGENGEFHSFVTKGPIFNQEIEFCLSEIESFDKYSYIA